MSVSGKRIADVSGMDLKKHISHLYLDITHGYSYQHVAFVHQTSNDADFGKINLDLPDGYYVASLSGSRNVANIDSASGGGYNYMASNGDTFVCGFEFEVAGSNVTWNAKLERVVGKFRLNFTAKIPDNIDRVLIWPNEMYKKTEETNWPDYLSFAGSGTYPAIYISGSEGFSIEYVFTEAERKKNSFTLDVYVPTTTSVFHRNLSLFTLDSSGNEVYSSVIDNVPIERNRITAITGNPFGKMAGFSVKVDNAWKPDSTVVSF